MDFPISSLLSDPEIERFTKMPQKSTTTIKKESEEKPEKAAVASSKTPPKIRYSRPVNEAGNFSILIIRALELRRKAEAQKQIATIKNVDREKVKIPQLDVAIYSSPALIELDGIMRSNEPSPEPFEFTPRSGDIKHHQKRRYGKAVEVDVSIDETEYGRPSTAEPRTPGSEHGVVRSEPSSAFDRSFFSHNNKSWTTSDSLLVETIKELKLIVPPPVPSTYTQVQGSAFLVTQ